MTIAVITPSLPERRDLCVQAMQSVANQTIPCEHHVFIDSSYDGPAAVRNFCMARATGTLVAFLDDDDLMDPDHLEALTYALLETNADLAFSWYRKVGRTPETERVDTWDDYAYGVMLGGRNLIPVTVVAKRRVLLDHGGFQDERYEDYSLWMRLLAAGSQFVVVPRETWTYRMLGENRTWQ